MYSYKARIISNHDYDAKPTLYIITIKVMSDDLVNSYSFFFFFFMALVIASDQANYKLRYIREARPMTLLQFVLYGFVLI